MSWFFKIHLPFKKSFVSSVHKPSLFLGKTLIETGGKGERKRESSIHRCESKSNYVFTSLTNTDRYDLNCFWYVTRINFWNIICHRNSFSSAQHFAPTNIYFAFLLLSSTAAWVFHYFKFNMLISPLSHHIAIPCTKSLPAPAQFFWTSLLAGFEKNTGWRLSLSKPALAQAVRQGLSLLFTKSGRWGREGLLTGQECPSI